MLMAKKIKDERNSRNVNRADKLWRAIGHPFLALAYLVQAGLILVLSKSYDVIISGNFSVKDTLQTELSGSEVYSSGTQGLFTVNLTTFIISLLVVSAIMHLLVDNIIRRSRRGTSELTVEVRQTRWVGIGISGVITALILALVVGLRSLDLLLALVGLTTLVAFAGYLLEERSSAISRRVLYAFAGISALVPWLVLAMPVFLSAHLGDLRESIQWIYVVAACWALLLYSGVYSLYSGRRPFKLEATIFSSLVLFGMYSCLVWQVYATFLK